MASVKKTSVDDMVFHVSVRAPISCEPRNFRIDAWLGLDYDRSGDTAKTKIGEIYRRNLVLDAWITNGQCYGTTVAYRDPHSVELYEAKRMVQCLEKIHKALQKAGEAWGYTNHYGDILRRLCSILGVQRIGILNDDMARISASHWRDETWVTDGIDIGVSRVKTIIEHLCKETAPAGAKEGAA